MQTVKDFMRKIESVFLSASKEVQRKVARVSELERIRYNIQTSRDLTEKGRQQQQKAINDEITTVKREIEEIRAAANSKAQEIKAEAERGFYGYYHATAAGVDSGLLALIQSGVLSDAELMHEAEAANATMRRIIGAELAKSSDDSLYIDNLFKRTMQLPGNQLPTMLLYAQYLSIVGAAESDITPVLEKVLSVEPENKAAQLQLLAYAIKHENYDEIIARADTAILYNPEMLQLYYYRGLAYFLKDMPDEALATYRRGLQSRSEESDAKLVSDIFALIGDTEHELGNHSATMAAYDSALIYNPHNVQVLNNYAYYLAVDGENLERAEEMSLKTVKENPDNPIYIDTYMWVLFKQGRHEEAKAYAEKLLATNDDMSAVEYSHCGDIFAVCGDTERAVELWSEAQLKGDDSKILKRKIKKKKYIADEKRKKK